MSVIAKDQVDQEMLELRRIRLEKIQNDRRILMERKTASHEPFPDGAFAKLSRTNLWETVFEYLDPASRASANSTCATFRHLSAESVVVRVFSLLKNQESLYLKPRDHRKPFWRNNHSIWNLRLVCKSWKRSTEQVYLSEFSNPSWYINYPYKCFPLEHPVCFSMDSSFLLEAAQGLISLSVPKFLLRIAEIGTMFPPLDQNLRFLDRYGVYILGLHFQIFYNKRTRPVHRYLALVSVLTRLPNLKWLTVENLYENQRARESSDLLRNKLNEFPVPTIPSLELIRFQEDYENELILNEILRANPQVRSLTLPRETFVTAPLTLQLEKLTNLEAYHVKPPIDADAPLVTSVLPSVNWPLKHLNIGVAFYSK